MKKKIIIISILIGSINLIAIVVLIICLIGGITNYSINKSNKYIKASGWNCSEEEFVTKYIPMYEKSIETIFTENDLVLTKVEMVKSYQVYKTVYYSDVIYVEFMWSFKTLKSYNYADCNIKCYLYDIEIDENLYNKSIKGIENLLINYGNLYSYDFHSVNNLLSELHNDASNSENYSSSHIYYYDSLVGNLGYTYRAGNTGDASSNYYDPLNMEDRAFININYKTLLYGKVVTE